MAISTPAIAVTSVGNATTANTVASGSWTPTAGELLLVFAATRNTTMSSPAISTTHANTSFTVAQTAQVSGAIGAVFGWAIVGSSPGSGAITVDFGASGIRHTLQIIRVASGFRSFGTIGLTASANQTSGTSITATLASAAPTRDLLIGFAANNNASDITAGTGSELEEISSTGGTPIIANVQYLNGGGGASMLWNGLNSSNATAILAAVRAPGARTT